MAQTLDENFGVKVDHFVQIDFCAFKQIVDAVGGVSVPFTYPVRDANTGLNVARRPAATSSAATRRWPTCAAGTCSTRTSTATWKTDGTSDFGRIARQQDFLRRMLQAASAKGLFSPSVVRGLIDAVQKYVVFDEGFSIDDMLKFAGLLREIPPTSIHTYQVQVDGQDESAATRCCIPQIDGANMKAILDIFRGTAALAGAPEQVDDTTTSAATSDAEASTTTTTAGGDLGPVTAAAATVHVDDHVHLDEPCVDTTPR